MRWPCRFTAFPYPGSFPLDFAATWIKSYSKPGELVYDPFCGRGTTLLAAAMLERHAAGGDRSPLARLYSKATLTPADTGRVLRRLESIDLTPPDPDPAEWEAWERFSPYFHPRTFGEILALRRALNPRRSRCDRDIAAHLCARMLGKSMHHLSPVGWLGKTISTRNRLRNNYRHGASLEYRGVVKCLAHTLKRLSTEKYSAEFSLFANKVRIAKRDAEKPFGKRRDIAMILTSPPYPGVIDFAKDNALPLWFLERYYAVPRRLGFGANLAEWREWIHRCMAAWSRSLMIGGVMILEVGEVVRNGQRVDLASYLTEKCPPTGLQVVETFSIPRNGPKYAQAFHRKQTGTQALRGVVYEKM
jgi:DNA methylase